MRIRIRQIYFDEAQLAYLCPLYEPFDNSKSPADFEWYEYGVMRKSFEEGYCNHPGYSGIFSWRFEQKTGIRGKQFNSFVIQNPGYDVYFINPFPGEEITYPNPWVQGNISHPGLMEITQQIFLKLNIQIKLKELVFLREQIAYSNYWVGNLRFWRKYMEFTLPIARLIEHDRSIRNQVLQQTTYNYEVPFLPFLMERLFSTLLLLEPGIKSKKFQYPSRLLLEKYENHIKNQEAHLQRLTANLDYAVHTPGYRAGQYLLHRPFRFLRRWLTRNRD